MGYLWCVQGDGRDRRLIKWPGRVKIKGIKGFEV